MTSRLSAVLLVVVMAVSIFVGGVYYLYLINPVTVYGEELKNFDNYIDLQAFLSFHRIRGLQSRYFIDLVAERDVVFFTTALPVSKGSEQPVGMPNDYSLTNVQVKGIDEPDYVKTDGRYIYMVSNDFGSVYILDSYPYNEMELVSIIDVPNVTVSGLYISGDKLVILADRPRYYIVFESSVRSEVAKPAPPVTQYMEPIIPVYIYDVSNHSQPSLIYNVSFPGWMIGSRLTESVLYLVVAEPVFNGNESGRLPVYYINGEKFIVDASEIYFDPDMMDYDFIYTVLFAIDLGGLTYNYTVMLTGSTSVLYMSYENIYLTQFMWQTGLSKLGKTQGGEKTKIYKFAIDGVNMVPIAVGIVDGRVQSQLQLDEYKGYLRVSTYQWMFDGEGGDQPHTNIYVLDSELNIVGSIIGISPSERLYATRFMGDYAYLVTFRVIDPFFVIDLSDPENPVILGELKIPGFSSMLQPLWDSLVIGIGYDVNETTRRMYLKLSLFDVSDPSNPREVDKIVFDDERWDWSEAAYNHRAILIVQKYGFVGIPLQGYRAPFMEKGMKMKYGFLMVNVTIDGFGSSDILIMEDEFEVSYQFPSYLRGLYIEDTLYFIIPWKINLYQLPTLDYLGTYAI
jgi:uncharacterized secreted protein with C-terminal beta-propeller domain